MSTFTDHTPDTAPPPSRRLMTAVRDTLGFLPTPVARMAASPSALDGFLTLTRVFDRSSLDQLARETLILTVATRTGCHYCVAMHSAALDRAGASPTLIDALRRQRPLDDPRLEAVREFTHQVMDHAGAVPDEALQTFLDAGHDSRQALDVVLGIATYTLSTFANRLTGAPLDEAFRSWAWHPEPTPASGAS